MRFSKIYEQNPFVLSYELFPPKTDNGLADLQQHLTRLLTYNPHFITCTYGAGGSTRDKTLATLQVVRELTALPLASHLTCVRATADDIRAYVQRAIDAGIENIVAIRGDIPQGETEFKVTDGGFAYGNELVAFLHSEFPQLGVAVGGYPEKHPEAVSLDEDIQNLKRKVDAGADVIITQLFFDNADFYRFRDKCAAVSINVPIVPGMMTVTSGKQLTRVTSLGASRPDGLAKLFDDAGEDADTQFNVGLDFAIQQNNDLIEQGVAGLHFYVLNKSKATMAVLDELHPLH